MARVYKGVARQKHMEEEKKHASNPSEYDGYREFIKTLNKTYSSYLVLVKSE